MTRTELVPPNKTTSTTNDNNFPASDWTAVSAKKPQYGSKHVWRS